MRRPDLLTYDLDSHTTRPRQDGPSRAMIALLVVVLLLGAALVAWVARTPSSPQAHAAPPGNDPAPAATTTPTTPPATATTTAMTGGTAVPLGSDDTAPRQAPAQSRTAAARFVQAWLQHDPAQRKAALDATATPGLVEQLMMTAPGNIPDATAAGRPVLRHSSAYGVQYDQRLSDGTTVRVYLAADPQARYGWVATAIEKA